MSDAEKLRAFAQDVMEGWPEFAIDGADLQEMAEKHGLLVAVEVSEPCREDEGCSCAEMGADFPTKCYRKTVLLTGDIAE